MLWDARFLSVRARGKRIWTSSVHWGICGCFSMRATLVSTSGFGLRSIYARCAVCEILRASFEGPRPHNHRCLPSIQLIQLIPSVDPHFPRTLFEQNAKLNRYSQEITKRDSGGLGTSQRAGWIRSKLHTGPGAKSVQKDWRWTWIA